MIKTVVVDDSGQGRLKMTVKTVILRWKWKGLFQDGSEKMVLEIEWK